MRSPKPSRLALVPGPAMAEHGLTVLPDTDELFGPVPDDLQSHTDELLTFRRLNLLKTRTTGTRS